MKKTQHMDWHFQTNQRLTEAMRRGQSRSWWLDEMVRFLFSYISPAHPLACSSYHLHRSLADADLGLYYRIGYELAILMMIIAAAMLVVVVVVAMSRQQQTHHRPLAISTPSSIACAMRSKALPPTPPLAATW